jgi:hypothetical protein
MNPLIAANDEVVVGSSPLFVCCCSVALAVGRRKVCSVALTVCPPDADALGVLEAPTGGLAAPAAFSLDDSSAVMSARRGVL